MFEKFGERLTWRWVGIILIHIDRHNIHLVLQIKQLQVTTISHSKETIMFGCSSNHLNLCLTLIAIQDLKAQGLLSILHRQMLSTCQGANADMPSNSNPTTLQMKPKDRELTDFGI